MVKLHINSVSKAFNGKAVLDGFSLKLEPSEMCCLLGPSGCGKSTTLQTIAGFLKPDSGTVELNGRDVTGLSPQKRKVGLVFQSYALFPHLNVFENVAYGLKRQKLKKPLIRKKVEEMLHLVRLENHEHRYIHELSGGQQQRIALARSLVLDPDLLLLDEPLSNLDAKLRVHMRNEIMRIHKKLNLTTIYVTHDQEEAMSIADRIVVMNEGVIEQTGNPRDVYESPKSLFVADFIGQVNLIQCKVQNDRIELFGKTIKPSIECLSNKDIVCAVRPENIRLTTPDASNVNGVIQSSIYLGPLVHYSVSFDSDVPDLLVETAAPKARFSTDQTVGVQIEDKDIRFFPS